MWKYKTNCLGEMTTAVKRRCGTQLNVQLPDLSTHEERASFGYSYLEFVAEATNTGDLVLNNVVNNQGES